MFISTRRSMKSSGKLIPTWRIRLKNYALVSVSLLSLVFLFFHGSCALRSPRNPGKVLSCDSDYSLTSCIHSGLFHYLEGSIHSRLYSLCIVDAYSKLADTDAVHAWVQNANVSFLTFEDVVHHETLAVKNVASRTVISSSYAEIELSPPSCSEQEGAQILPPISIFVHRSIQGRQWTEVPSCDLRKAMSRCFQRLEPSPAVASIMSGENIARLANSTAVYTQAGMLHEGEQLSRCYGCPTTQLLNCTIRRMAMDYLRDPNVDHTVVGQWASDALAVQDSFHVSRSPLVLSATVERMNGCPHQEGSSMAAGHHVDKASRRRDLWRKRHVVVLDRLRRDHGWNRRKLSQINPSAGHCEQFQMAELFLLSQSKQLIYSFRSPATEFLEARIHGKEASVCDSPPIKPITKQRFAQQIFIDENVKAIYCSVPKVACTSWKTWFRQVAMLPDPNDTWIAHDPGRSGLKELWYSYSEYEGIRAVTRKDMFRFTFVRNPFSRMASVYLDKHINGGPPYTRRHWIKKFFGRLGRIHPKLSHPFNAMSLEEFAGLVEVVMRGSRRDIEPHIAPQVDLCGLDFVKYDFVGRFESLDDDVRFVMNVLGTQPYSAFSLGLIAHPTNSSGRLVDMYTKATYKQVKHTFEMDFNIPFNNVSYEPPEALAKAFESES